MLDDRQTRASPSRSTSRSRSCSSLWIGPGASTVQDLVLPRMRGSASAAYLLVVTFIGLALGPYTVGRLSVALGDLRTALLCALIAAPPEARCS